MTTITGQTNAYLGQYSRLSMDDYDKTEAVDQFTFCNELGSEYVLIGRANITITLIPRADAVSNAVETLRAELAQSRADAQMNENRIVGKISKLLAITNEAAL